MPSGYPTTIDNFSDPGPTTYEDAAGFEHDVVESNQNRAINNIETYVGATGSAVSSTLTYKLNNNVVHRTTDESIAGQKNFTNTDTLFQRAYTKYRPINFMHDDWGVVDDGGAADQSTAFALALAAGAEEYYLPRGTYQAGGLSVPAGTALVIRGSGPGSRLVSNGNTILTVGATGANTDNVTFKNFSIETSADIPYTQPLIHFIKARGIQLEGMNEVLTGTGTAYHFDCSYIVSVTGGWATMSSNQTGVWAEISTDTDSAVGMDMFTITKLVRGKYGILCRAAGPTNTCYNIVNLKVVNPTNDGTNDTTLASGVSAGATSISVASATGLAASQPLTLDYGVNVEVVKIASSYVSGTTIPLQYAARFAHSSGKPVIRGGIGASFPAGTTQVKVGGRAEQLRAQLMLDDTKGVEVSNSFISSKALAIFAGGAPSIELGSRDMWGWSSVNNSVEFGAGATGGTVRFRRPGRQGGATAVTEISGTPPAGSTILYEGQNTGSGTTANRPTATLFTAGATYYDTTLGRNIWSDGSAWQDPLGATPNLAFARSTADQIVNNSATAVDATGNGPGSVIGFSIGVSEVWDFDVVVFYNSGTTPDIKFSLTGPAGATLTYGGTVLRSGATTSSDTITMADSGTIIAGGVTTATNVVGRITGLAVNSTTPGTVKLRFAQNTADVSDTTLLAGSFIRATKRA